jgi:hypothetical protein
MGNDPDGLIVSQAWDRAAIHDLEDASSGPGGVGRLIEKRAGDYIKQGLGLSTLPPGRDNAHLFALSRTLRIRQAFGLRVSTDYSISPLPTIENYRSNSERFS